MKIEDADIVWFPSGYEVRDAPLIRVERHGNGWARNSQAQLEYWMPACSLGVMGTVKTDTLEKKLLAMFVLFNTIVVRDGVPVGLVHEAFCEIDEYRQAISPDSPGAEQ